VIYPRGDSKATKDFIGVFLCLGNCKSALVYYQLSAFTSNQEILTSTPLMAQLFLQNCCHGYSKLLSQQLLLLNNNILKADELHIKCKVK
jgi:hypothetical protein